MRRRQRYRLHHEGREIVVTWDDPGWSRDLVHSWPVTMTVITTDATDDDGPDDASGDDVTRDVSLGARVRLTAGGVTVVFRRTPLGRLGGCDVLDRPVRSRDEDVEAVEADGEHGAGWTGLPPRPSELIPMEPTPGTRAARRHRWRQRHPRLHAARHVARAVTTAVVGALGIGALLTALLPRIDWSWLPRLPRIDLPDLPLPDLPFPRLDLPDLPDLPDPPGWLVAVIATAKWWIPILLAIGAAVREVRAVRRRQADRSARSGGAAPCLPSTPPVTPPDGAISSTRRQPASPSEASSAPPLPRSVPGRE